MHEKILIAFIILMTILFLFLLGFILNIVFLYRKKQSYHKNEVALIKTTYEKELLKTQLEIQEQTFSHIALELHDNVGHFISVAKLYLTTLSTDADESLKNKINHSIGLLTASLDEVRNISRRLNTESIKENGLIRTVEQLINHVEKSENFRVYLNVIGKTYYLDDQKEIVLFRIVQEAFNNIIKHSEANEIYVDLIYTEVQLEMKIRDNGVGFKVEETLQDCDNQSSGLKNIIKRSKMINATYMIDSRPGQGTLINIVTPFNNTLS